MKKIEVFIPEGEVSEEAKRKMENMMKKRAERLAKIKKDYEDGILK
jgi:hypothetical protein